MPIDYDKIKNWQFPEIEQTYTAKDSILYALGVGYGHDPMDEAQLRFVYEKNLRVAPTMPVVMGHPGFWMMNPATGIDWVTDGWLGGGAGWHRFHLGGSNSRGCRQRPRQNRLRRRRASATPDNRRERRPRGCADSRAPRPNRA